MVIPLISFSIALFLLYEEVCNCIIHRTLTVCTCAHIAVPQSYTNANKKPFVTHVNENATASVL